MPVAERRRRGVLLRLLRAGRNKKHLRSRSKRRRRKNLSLAIKTHRGETAKVRIFRRWCDTVGIQLHKKVYIGRKGSCHEIGVVATDSIKEGEELALIPRPSVLTAVGGVAAGTIREDVHFQSQVDQMTPWIPLLIAMTAEYAQDGKSKWQSYLDLVPNNGMCPPPMLWDEGERERLLSGTGVDSLVRRDLQRITQDYTTVVEPFFKRHKELIPERFHSLSFYEKNVSFVMSYSFTDDSTNDPLSTTMMVPFVDLLNHHDDHNAELSYHKKYLRLVAIKDIEKGEEIFNTFGRLPNYSLLHTYGFVIPNNSCEAACVPSELIKDCYVSLSEKPDDIAERWQTVKDNDLLFDSYEIDGEGQPEEELLKLIRLLLCKKFVQRVRAFDNWTVNSLEPQEKRLVQRIIEGLLLQLDSRCGRGGSSLECGSGLLEHSCENVSLVVTMESRKCLLNCLKSI